MNQPINCPTPDTENSLMVLLGLEEHETRKRYPHIYQTALTPPASLPEDMQDYYCDSFLLSNVAEVCDNSTSNEIASAVDASLISAKNKIIVNWSVYNSALDPEHKYPISSDSSFESNTTLLHALFETEKLYLNKTCDFTVEAKFTMLDASTKEVTTIVRSSNTSISTNGSIVTDFQVNHPRRIQSSTPGQMVVCYNRDATPTEKADYSYQNVIITKDDDPTTQTLSIHLPFAGSITLNDAFQLVGVNKADFILHLGINGQSGGCDYNMTNFPFDKVFKTVGNTLTWSLKNEIEHFDLEDWNSPLKAERVYNNVGARFYAKIGFIYKDPLSPDNLFDNVEIRSPYSIEPHTTSSNTKVIETILFWWGCLGKETLVEMANGTQKPIREIITGDRVRLTNGSESTVDCVLSGKEKQVLHITAGEYTLLASEEHPLMTRRGLVRAKNLNAADELETISGFLPLDTCYSEEYDDLVYSLRLESIGCHFGNGFICGDFAAQQEKLPYEQLPKQWHPYEGDPLSDEIADLLTSRRPQKRSTKNMAAKPYYACRFEDAGESYATLHMSRAPQFAGNEFTLDGWFFIAAESRQLLKQKSGFSLAVDNQTIIITAPNDMIFSAVSPFPLIGDWIHLFFTYDNEILSIGVNGLVIATHEVQKVCFLQNLDMILGAHFTGYLRRLTIYSVCLEHSLLRTRMFQNVCSRDMEIPVAFVDGASGELTDLGPNILPILTHGNCRAVNLVHGFQPEPGDCALLENADQINPGGFTSAHFGVYLKCYTPSVFENKSVLFSNGRFGEPDALLLYLQSSDPFSASLRLYYGGRDCLISDVIGTNIWLDIILSYNASNGYLTAYCNAEQTVQFALPLLKRTRPGEFRIGNGWDIASNHDAPSSCLFTEVAVYNTPISPEKANSLYDAQPFVFDSNCVALFNFESNGAREWVSQRKLCITPREHQLRAQTSASHLSQNHYWYDIYSKINPPSNRACTLLLVYNAYMQTMFGIVADGINAEYQNATCRYLEQTLLENSTVCKLFEPNPDDRILCGCIIEFGKAMDVLLTATCANNLYNRRKSNLSDKLGINCILASVSAIVLAGNRAAIYERNGILPEVFKAMREALNKII